jgi:hypothetical protein
MKQYIVISPLSKQPSKRCDMVTADELRVLNHIIEDMEDHPECIQLSPEEMDKILEEYDQISIRERHFYNIQKF